MASHVTDTDQGAAAMLARIFDLAHRKPAITVGIHEAEGAEDHPVDGAEEAVTIIAIAIANEFGTVDEKGNVHTPERSFIRAWFDEAEAGLREDLVKLARSVVEGKRTADEILEILGLRAVGQIQSRIAQGIAPANAQSTIDRKGSSTPLVDQGILRSSITYEIDKG